MYRWGILRWKASRIPAPSPTPLTACLGPATGRRSARTGRMEQTGGTIEITFERSAGEPRAAEFRSAGHPGRSFSTHAALLQRYQPFHQFRVIFLLDAVDLLVVFVDLRGIIHGAEFRAAHGAESGLFVIVVGGGFIVHGAGGFGIEREGELFLPVEFVAGEAEGV